MTEPMSVCLARRPERENCVTSWQKVADQKKIVLITQSHVLAGSPTKRSAAATPAAAQAASPSPSSQATRLAPTAATTGGLTCSAAAALSTKTPAQSS